MNKEAIKNRLSLLDIDMLFDLLEQCYFEMYIANEKHGEKIKLIQEEIKSRYSTITCKDAEP